jgi:hypothetical protein
MTFTIKKPWSDLSINAAKNINNCYFCGTELYSEYNEPSLNNEYLIQFCKNTKDYNGNCLVDMFFVTIDAYRVEIEVLYKDILAIYYCSDGKKARYYRAEELGDDFEYFDLNDLQNIKSPFENLDLFDKNFFVNDLEVIKELNHDYERRERLKVFK